MMYRMAGASTASPGVEASATIILSARRAIVRAMCNAAAAGEPPGNMKDFNGCSSAFISSISRSSRSTWLSTIRNADLILVMNDGNIIEQGTHEQLLKQGGFYAELYNSQFDQSVS